ncbi:hypothetical protein IC620_14405 [Hazenella sp. IB182357]|uniref:HEAT repeat domain-containing protein n=1 Tax=Polycladospora coralii TaxID=2771432 RepID=A0A926RUX9_9BACL|nr:hypothetical protein [Polycladospora coralii]MBD1373543.1 hypothetical protein [Polycladospora coralii]
MNWDFFKRTKKYPADLYTKEYKEEVLCSIENDNQWTKIPLAFLFMLSKSDEEKVRTAQILHKCVMNLTYTQMANLDTIFRDRTSMDWSYDWGNESPRNLLLTSMNEEERVSILGLCTFHPNGYFREKALHTLANFETGREIPFFLFRCNDWVPEIRRVARMNFENRISIKYGKEIVQNLPIVFKLRNAKRADHSVLIEKILQFLAQKEAIAFLEQGTKSEFNKVRFFCYKIMIHSKTFNKEALLNYLLQESEPHLRFILMKEILNDISIKKFNDIFPILSRDKFPKIRVEVLQKYYTFHLKESIPILEETLLDKNGSIRSIARYLLEKQNITNFVSYYKRVIHQGPNEKYRGALLGLGEVANKDHIDLVLPFLQDDKVGLIKAAIRTIRMLDGNTYKNEFIHLLSHEHRGVSKEATRSLQSTFFQDMETAIYHVYQNAQYDHTKYNAAVLLCSLPKWNSLPYIILFYVCKEDQSVSHLGKLQLVNWLATFNKTFSIPDKEQINYIQCALKNHGKKLIEEEKRQIEFYIKGF